MDRPVLVLNTFLACSKFGWSLTEKTIFVLKIFFIGFTKTSKLKWKSDIKLVSNGNLFIFLVILKVYISSPDFFPFTQIETTEAGHGHHGHHDAKGTACIVKGSYCNCHYCKCEKGHVHCGGYGKHGHGKFSNSHQPKCSHYLMHWIHL